MEIDCQCKHCCGCELTLPNFMLGVPIPSLIIHHKETELQGLRHKPISNHYQRHDQKQGQHKAYTWKSEMMDLNKENIFVCNNATREELGAELFPHVFPINQT